MKVATNHYFNSLAARLGGQQSRIADLQAKLATGDNLVTPGAAPSLAARSLDLRSVVAREQALLDNLGTLDARLGTEEVVLTSMRELLTRMRELTVRAANDTYSDGDRRAMAVELQGYRDELLALANSTDVSGAFLFAGASTGTRPFVEDEQGAVVYRADRTPVHIGLDLDHVMRSNASVEDLLPVVTRQAGQLESRTSAFQVIDDLIAAVRSADGAGIQQGLRELDAVTGGIDDYTVNVGLRRNIIESRQEITRERKQAVEALYSQARDLDYAKAVTELSAQVLALEAAQSTIAKISQLSLFDYLR